MAAKRNLIYQVAVGEIPSFYATCIDSVRRYCKTHGCDHILQTEPLLRIRPKKSKRSENALRLGYLPIFEKENAFALLDTYEKVAILDADVFVRRHAPGIFEETQDSRELEAIPAFAGVVERTMPLVSAYREKIRKYSEGQYRGLTDVDWKWNEDGAEFYNMGVMVLGQGFRDYLNGETPEQFIHRPEFERFVNGEGHFKWSTDQTLLNYFVKKSGMSVTNLDWKWNALYGAVKDIEQAYFVHFFLSAKMERKGAEIPGIIEKLRHHSPRT
jgi:hypothetical protein